MKVLVTGGAGFMGRWISKKFLAEGNEVYIYDNLSSGSESNIREFRNQVNLVQGDIRNKSLLKTLFDKKFDICIHAAAQINVQRSIDCPSDNFEVNVIGSENVLQECHRTKCKMIHISSCMVYDLSGRTGIGENHPVLPKSPYAASKLAADVAALSYHYAYKDNVIILRPFNTYGPFQRWDTEGGVVPIFINQSLTGKPITIFGKGLQTRDLLYVEDCAEFVFKASISNKTPGQVLNAGLDKDISVIELARMIGEGKKGSIEFVKHPHPQSEIRKLLCNSRKARKLLKWKPKVDIQSGVEKLRDWMAVVGSVDR